MAPGDNDLAGVEHAKYETKTVKAWDEYIRHKCNGESNGAAIISSQWNGRGQGYYFSNRPEIGDVGGGC